jgi:DNA invertase Pin-like site-specific DNA recombinase
MRVIAYIRVSSDEQAKDGVSLDVQLAKEDAYASLYDLQIVERIEDAGISAKSLKRPGLQRALELLRTGQADGLLICKLDRLSRSVKDWNTLIDGYFSEKAGKQLFSVGDSIDTRTAAGRLVLNVLMSVAQWEREIIGERTRDALGYKKSKGERTGTVPFGYDLAADEIQLIPNTREQEALALIATLRNQGFGIRRIASELTQRGFPTKAGLARWSHQTVAKLLKRAA